MSFQLTKSQIVNNYRAGVGLPLLPQGERPSIRSVFSDLKDPTPKADVFTVKTESNRTFHSLFDELEQLCRHYSNGKDTYYISRVMNSLKFKTRDSALPGELNPTRLGQVLPTYALTPVNTEVIPSTIRLKNVGKGARSTAFDVANKILNPHHPYRYIQPDNAAYADAVANVFRQVLNQP
jgi:hypothetical protein